MGELCAILAKSFKSSDSICWMGQTCQGNPTLYSVREQMMSLVISATSETLRSMRESQLCVIYLMLFSLKISIYHKTISNSCVGLGIDKMQTPHQSLRTHWLHQHHHYLPRRFSLCIRWKRRHHNAVGLE